MIRLAVDKIASSTKNVRLSKDLWVREEVIAEEGYVVAGRIHGHKTVYNEVEDINGRMVTLNEGDIIVGTLGHRDALHNYSGVVPKSIKVGDRLQLLNLGGVIGQCTSANPKVGKPFDVEVLGGVLVFPEFGSREGKLANIKMNALDAPTDLTGVRHVPVVYVAGTCMQSGKTLASCTAVRGLASHGLQVGACKLTGISMLRDTLRMQDYGAKWAVSFNDAGVVTTNADTSLGTSRKIVAHLSNLGADVIVAELGAGILDRYGVQNILADEQLMSRKGAIIMCASDPVGVWGGVQILKQTYDLTADVISGPATDNAAGTEYVEQELKIAAINAMSHRDELGAHIYRVLKNRNLVQ